MPTTPPAEAAGVRVSGRRMWPLYAAGFTTAFGAHAVEANLGGSSNDAVRSLLTLGALLALYDGAEVLLKPVFGTVADRIGARPVLLGGLVGFALASALYVAAGGHGWLWVARLGQGAAASAFSPSASALVARLNPEAKHGRAFGRYGFYKSIGYALGPLLGGALVWIGGFRLLFAVLTALGVVVAAWALLAVPDVPPLPRTRQTVVDLARRVTDPVFLRPTAALAGATAALSVGVGFLPVTGAAAGLGTIATVRPCRCWPRPPRWSSPGPAVPWTPVASARGPGLTIGLFLAAVGLGCATLRGLVAVLLAAVLIGVGTGLITSLGFAALAASTPPERLGQTMGIAELGRELGDAGGPLLVAGVATAAALSYGDAALAIVVATGPATGLITAFIRNRRDNRRR